MCIRDRLQAESQLEIVTKEGDTMRRVFESGITQGAHFNTMLKEQLDIVRDTMGEQATAARQELDTLTSSVADLKARRNQLELDKFASEQELEKRVADVTAVAEDTQLAKETLDAKLVDSEALALRLRDALETSVNEADRLSNELDRAERQSEAVQREAVTKVDSTLREKDLVVLKAQDMAAVAKKEANMAKMTMQEAEAKAQRAEIMLTRAKHELGTALTENLKLKHEKEQADSLLGVLSSQIGEVQTNQETLAAGFEHQVRVANDSLEQFRGRA
eukprot:TRINITY_DN26085_c0_g1_i4.p1 TRINITY_DN26085_c0_g1~~TRINITY_DN26085_c0_g1_i4.p1  ORF type:complete len:276 (+),score=119.50 TRINITY_DN26085_c0_g1_i4:152-979(+)